MSDNKRYASVSEMIRDTSEDPEFASGFDREMEERQLMKHLVAHRVKSNVSQKEVSDHFGCTQGSISKFEAGKDDDIRLGALEKYADAVGLKIRMTLMPKKHTAVNEIKYHAFRIKDLLHRLVDTTGRDDQIDKGVTEFVCLETPVNLLKIVVDTAMKLPHKALKQLPGFIVEDECFACEYEDTDNDESSAEIQKVS